MDFQLEATLSAFCEPWAFQLRNADCRFRIARVSSYLKAG